VTTGATVAVAVAAGWHAASSIPKTNSVEKTIVKRFIFLSPFDFELQNRSEKQNLFFFYPYLLSSPPIHLFKPGALTNAPPVDKKFCIARSIPFTLLLHRWILE
jgi:hypothetical protein